MAPNPSNIKGRGAVSNPPNRFEPLHLEPDTEGFTDEELPAPKTEYLRDESRSIIASNDSPDVPFRLSINPYRGCTHGCAYCFARIGHEYLGFSAGLDFETKIIVKPDAPELLRRELSAPRYAPAALAVSGVTDCYQPIERKLELTRRCLQVCAEFKNPVGVITKNHLVTRDVDVLRELAAFKGVTVMLSVTTLDQDLSRVMEPGTSTPQRRLEAIETLAAAGIPVGVMVAPVIPGLTDHELPSILAAAADVGAQFAGFVPLRLPGAVATVFQDWLHRHYPDRAEMVLNRLRSMRGGKLYDSTFGERMTGSGIFADQIRQLFEVASRRAGLARPFPTLSTDAFRRPGDRQLSLFE